MSLCNISVIYFQGYYNSMDSGLIDEEGYISVLSRSDDVINVAGHRLSTGALEEVKNLMLYSLKKIQKQIRI